MKRVSITGCVFFAVVLMTSCSKTLYPVPHQTIAEQSPNGAPYGSYFEPHCLKEGHVYTLEIPNAILFGRVIRMKRHERLTTLKKKALDADDSIVFKVEHSVTDSTNYLNATRTSLMQGHGYPLKDSAYVTTLRHGDIRSFNCLGSGNRLHAVSTPWRYEVSPHGLDYNWHGAHLCPLEMQRTYLLHVVSRGEPSQFRVVFGAITSKTGNLFSVTIRNEINSRSNLHALASKDIMTYGIGFPRQFSIEQTVINHDDIVAFRPISKVSSRSRPPQNYAGQSAGATLFLLGALIAGFVLIL